MSSERFALERLTGALIAHDADPSRPPLRRAGAVALTGVLLAALTAGVLAGYGMLSGAGAGLAEPTDPSAVLLDRRTGARYVYLESDRRLHPVLNYTSGLLLAAGPRPGVKTVTAARLAEVPLGATLGIPDAPDALPTAGNLLGGAWTVCTENGASTLLVGFTPDGPPVTDRALLVRDPAGRTFLVHDGRRFRVDSTMRGTAWPVAAAWIDAVPAGPDLISPPVPAIADPPVRACVTRPADGPASVRLNPAVPSGTPVYVPRGHGAVVTSPTGAVQVVTDEGRAYPLASRELLVTLGYPDVRPVPVPAELVTLLPAGPLLDPERARRH
ncbi:type VII secretion protein EccB [Actinoplanes palleronii]|uniref:Type VII secretion protein EccB n=1 Tax=Actinoplanes palleronii TaxID=113570 RepID=A0ABQ4B753_9ACTN|nr:type VII secretion protein EccB [Actinoplanes palleronii]GIE66489.1 hypothetical protein Apa02nite_025970 [Actinoplanes palleronii]